MGIITRARLSLSRNKVKTLLLFFIIFLLGLLLIFTFSANSAISITQNNLRLQMPAITGLMLNDENLTGSSIQNAMNRTQVTHEMISNIGNLPYVLAFDFNTRTTMESADLYRAVPKIDVSLMPDWIIDEIPGFQTGLRDDGGFLESFAINGITNPKLTDVDAGLISLSDGRTFTQAEIDEGHQVAIISRTLATQNDLAIGSILTFQNNVYNELALQAETDGTFFRYWHLDEFIFEQQIFKLEVIGIFEVEHQFDYSEDFVWDSLLHQFELHNRVYVSNILTEQASLFNLDIMLRESIRINDISHYGATPEEVLDINAFFFLHDSRDADIFIRTANEMLPPTWEIRDFSGTHAAMTASLTHLNTIAQNILMVAILVGIVVLTLVITLFLSDKKREIGIYLALGEQKQKIITQVILEMVTVFVFAMVGAFIVGGILSNIISRNIVQQELTNQSQTNTTNDFGLDHLGISWNLYMYNPGLMSFDEMLESFDSSLTLSTISLFFAIGTLVVLISTTLPMISLMKLEPKEILTLG